MRTQLKNIVLATTVTIGATSYANSHASAYPIDCAILICMAGGFPASAESNVALPYAP